MAVEHANRVIDWQSNLTSEEIPPMWMWPFDEELELWFEDVEERRKARWGGSSEEDESMTKNELARRR